MTQDVKGESEFSIKLEVVVDEHYKFPNREIAAVELEVSRRQHLIFDAVDHVNDRHNPYAASKILDYFFND